MIEVSPWIWLVLYAAMVLVGFALGRVYECNWAGKRAGKQVAIPLFVGEGDEGEMVKGIELSDDEARLILVATSLFVKDMEEKYGPLFLPTDTEQAQADIILEGNQSEDGGELGDTDWVGVFPYPTG